MQHRILVVNLYYIAKIYYYFSTLKCVCITIDIKTNYLNYILIVHHEVAPNIRALLTYVPG